MADVAPEPPRSPARQTPRLDSKSLLRAIGVGFFLVVVTSATLLLDLVPSQRVQLNEGDVSPRDILAPADKTYTSAIRTRQAQDAQARAVQDIFDPPDATIAREQEIRAQQILDYVSTIRQDPYPSDADKVAAIAAIPELKLPPEVISQILVLGEEQWRQAGEETLLVLARALQGEIREDQLDDVRRRLPILVNHGLSTGQTNVVLALTGELVAANTLYNAARTEEARQEARESTQPVVVTVRLGEALVRAGDRVTATDIEALDAFGVRQTATPWQAAVGTLLFSLVAVVLLELFVHRFQPTLWRRGKVALVVSLLVAVFVVLAKLMLPIPDSVVPYLYPLPALSMILSILFGPALGMAAGVAVALVGVFVSRGSLQLSVYLVAGTLAGALVLGRAEKLSAFLQGGLAVALSNAVVVALFGFLTPAADWVEIAITALAALVMGGLAASLTLAAFLALSAVLDIITPFQLMELARPNHPLFRQLLLKAPGTYHHTLLVSNMAEEAANRVGADGLLARIGAYYHDIGKTVRPPFFTENRMGDEDPHAQLDPATSARIIIDHVHDGLDLAAKYRLPHAIRAFIPEHQGTGLTLAFYRQAVQASGNGGQDVREENFRYPGPKPQSKETAIVMLADSCEARVRSAKPTSAEEIEAIVRETVKYKRDSGELDECDLTLRDLETVQAAFMDVLQGVFHPRVQYPEPVRVKGADGRELVR